MSTSQIEKFETIVEIPDKVTVTIKKDMLHVHGPLGKTYKNFKKIPVSLKLEGKALSITALGRRKKDYAILNTASSIIKNLCEGVVEGYTIKMKIIYAHFPINVKTKDGLVLIENFQGERAPRTVKIHGDTKVVAKGDEIVLTGSVLTDVTQTAAEIESKTKVKNKDHRVFLDGIYVFLKSIGIEK